MSLNLPLEVLEQIVEALVPDDVVVLRSSNSIVKTILSLTSVSKFLSPIAYHLLYTYCMDIHSLKKLRLVVRSLKSQRVIDAISKPTHHVMGIFLAPYKGKAIVDAPKSVQQIELLCSVVADKLQRLIMDIPLIGLYDLEDRKSVEPLCQLHPAFAKLIAVRDLCSITDEFAMSTCYTCQEEYFYGEWPKLERLAVLNSEVEPAFTKTLAQAKELTHVQILMTHRHVYRPYVWGVPAKLQSLRLLLLAHDIPYDVLQGGDHDPYKYDGIGEVHEVDVPGVNKRETDFDLYESRLGACQEFMLQHACVGTIWDLGGDT